MGTYASDTSVSSEKSRNEIERTLARYGASSFMYGWEDRYAVVGFVVDYRRVRFTLPMPDRNAREFTHTPSRGNRRSDAQIAAAYEQAVRQRWRALALVVKAKLEAVEAGIVTFDQEFGMHFLLPSGKTVADEVLPAMVEAYRLGHMPTGGLLQIGRA
ncbi:hypothetical protein [Phycicoccus avicenniae]|uniref:hypothetical protein n=1 Tax=Phycicoccus avicenniae TaxID=2828860 RepID=UPI003D2B9C5E